METLQQYFVDNPRLKSLGKARLKAELKGLGMNKAIDAHFAGNETQQLLKPAQKRPKNLLYKITAPPLSFQVDVWAAYKTYASVNRGYGYGLLLVDILTRKAWFYPMKTHTMPVILETYKKFIKDLGQSPHALHSHPAVVEGDDEFDKKAFLDYNTSLGTKIYTDVAWNDHMMPGADRLGIVDRLCRTILAMLLKRTVDANEPKWKWYSHIAGVIADYNDNQHTTLGTTPNEAFGQSKSSQNMVHALETQHNWGVNSMIKGFEPGAKVRILQERGAFDKGGSHWSPTVHEVISRVGNKYLVRESPRKTGTFKTEELQRVGAETVTNPARVKASAAAAITKKKQLAKAKISSVKEGISVDKIALKGTAQPRNLRSSKPKTRSRNG